MARAKNIFYKQTILGEKTTVGQVSVTPQSQALMVRWRHGGVIWNRPLAVLVERDGQVERIRIMNVTHRIQLGLLGFSLIFCIIILLIEYEKSRTLRKRPSPPNPLSQLSQSGGGILSRTSPSALRKLGDAPAAGG